MKKIRTILTILPLLFSFSLVSCQRTDSSMSSSSLSYYEEVELEGLSSEQVKEMNHIFEESEFYPNGMEVDLRKTTQEDLYFGIYNDYVIRHYRYMNANKKYSFTPRLAYSLKEKKFYSVNDLYEKGVFSDDDMAAVAPLGYVKQVHKQEERVTYEVYVSKNTQECETNRMNVYVDGNTFAWYTSSIKDQPRINGEFLSIS